MDYIKELTQYLELLNGKGILLTSGKGTSNTMTASWGFGGVMWGKNIVVVPVRPQRFTHKLIQETGEFSISIPLDNDLNKVLGYCGKHSGKNTDKYEELGISPVRCKSIDTNIIPGNCYQIECRLIYTNNILEERLPNDVDSKWYGDKGYHSMFYGEIVNAYKTE